MMTNMTFEKGEGVMTLNHIIPEAWTKPDFLVQPWEMLSGPQ